MDATKTDLEGQRHTMDTDYQVSRYNWTSLPSNFHKERT